MDTAVPPVNGSLSGIGSLVDSLRITIFLPNIISAVRRLLRVNCTALGPALEGYPENIDRHTYST